MLGYKIENNKKMSIKGKIEQYNKPKKVYIPLINGKDRDVTILCKKGDIVSLGDMIAKTKGDLRVPILASISGKIIDFVDMVYLDGDKVKCVVIENNYDGELNNKKIDKKYTREEFVSKLQEKGIIGMGGAAFPTYAKYDIEKKIDTLIVNAVECEPYITSDFMISSTYCEEILEAIDMIMEINDIKECFIAIKKDNDLLKKQFYSYLGTYPNIKLKLVPSIYPMGYERLLVKYIKKQKYNNLPLEKGVVVNNISTIYAIYNALKYDNPLVERVITISGLVDNPLNVLVRVGTKVSDIINNFGKIDENLIYIASGPMYGKKVDINSLVVSPNLNGVVALEKCVNKVEECNHCGKCVSVCPKKLSPVLIKENIDNVDKLKELKAYRCIECGLCSYICPSKINVSVFTKAAKTKMEGGK